MNNNKNDAMRNMVAHLSEQQKQTAGIIEQLKDKPYTACVDCGNNTFIAVLMFKDIPPLLMPGVEKPELNFSVIQCKQCGHPKNEPPTPKA